MYRDDSSEAVMGITSDGRGLSFLAMRRLGMLPARMRNYMIYLREGQEQAPSINPGKEIQGGSRNPERREAPGGPSYTGSSYGV